MTHCPHNDNLRKETSQERVPWTEPYIHHRARAPHSMHANPATTTFGHLAWRAVRGTSLHHVMSACHRVASAAARTAPAAMT